METLERRGGHLQQRCIDRKNDGRMPATSRARGQIDSRDMGMRCSPADHAIISRVAAALIVA